MTTAPTTPPQTDPTIKTLNSAATDLINIRLEDQNYDAAIALLTSHFALAATSAQFSIPPPDKLAILITILVHPTTINTPSRRASAALLSRILDVSSPRTAKLPQVFTLSSRRRKRRAEDLDSDSEWEDFILERESLFGTADSIWDVLEWGFYRGGAWGDFVNLVVRIVGNDFEGVEGVGEVESSLLGVWLRDSGRKAAFNKAVRAIMATPGGEMMMDKPRALYPLTAVEEAGNTEVTDIWGGSMLLSSRIDLLMMMHRLSYLHPEFLREDLFLDSVVRRLIMLKSHNDLHQFLSNIPAASFRTALSEQLAFKTCPTARDKALQCTNLADRLFLAYLPSLPGKTAADLSRYCIATGILFRTWVRHKDDVGEGFFAFGGSAREVVEDALGKRERRVEEVGVGSREDVARVVAREGRVLKALVGKI